ncbi:MAG: chloride channel protein [Streptosporangiaceae bacterium]
MPVSVFAYFFLALVSKLQHWLYQSLPSGLGLGHEPAWWPFPLLAVAGLLVALVIKYLPGTGGHSPADGFHAGGGVASARELPGILLAAVVTLGFGAVLGPEAPLIALGGGLAAWAISRARGEGADRAKIVIASAGSFAAIATLLGSPLTAAFLLMEAAGLGGAILELVLVPGLLAAGIGALVFTGLDRWTGLGAFSLSIPGLPHFTRPTLAEIGYALLVGLAAAVVGVAIRRFALLLRGWVQPRLLVATPLAGLTVAGLAVLFSQVTGKGARYVLFSGQNEIGPFVASHASFAIGALMLLLACKAVAYGVSLSAFRGGPIFPAIFIGGVAGAALSYLPGLPLVAAMGMGIGAMVTAMLRLPLTAVLLASLLLASDGIAVMPLVIVAVVTAYVAIGWLDPPDRSSGAAPASG